MDMDVLTAQNVSQFWTSAWANGDTGWKHGERAAPFTRNLYAALVAMGAAPGSVPFAVPESRLDAPGVLSGEAERAAVARFVAGKSVLVPLCGDSAVVPYLVGCGARHVVGVDICGVALLRQREMHFAGVAFDTRPVGDALRHEAVLDAGARVTLFEGDVTQLPRCDAYAALSVDFVYDRAALMAIPPALRGAYLAAVARVLTPRATVALERMVRVVPAERDMGPPFMVDVAEVIHMYRHATGREYTAVRALVEERSGPRHVEWYALLPRA